MLLDWRGRNAFELLEVPIDADDDALTSAWRALSKVWHPDRFDAKDQLLLEEVTERFKAIKDAYDTLRDPASRRREERMAGFREVDSDWTTSAPQKDPETWKRMAKWMKEEDVGRGFDRRMAFQAGDCIERGRRPTDKQLPYMLAAWDLAIEDGFDPDE